MPNKNSQKKVQANLDKINAQIDELKAKSNQVKANMAIEYHIDAPIAKSERFPVHPVTLSIKLSPNRQWVVCPRA